MRGSDAHLPRGIRVLWAKPIDAAFHARHSARVRRYRYVIFNRERPSALLQGRVCWARRHLDADRMHAAAQVLLGEHDFSSFRAAGCQSRTPVRRVEAVSVRRDGDFLALDVEANAFLLHMVRNIAGALIAVGAKAGPEAPPHALGELLEARDRTLAPPTAVPDGLYLTGVVYESRWGLPAAGVPEAPGVLPF